MGEEPSKSLFAPSGLPAAAAEGPGERTVELRGVSAPSAVGVAAGDVLASRYQIEANIGDGGSGQVFRAWDRVLGEPVALKILRPDRAREKSWIRRLAREVRVARAIRHANVCRVFDLGTADGHWFISMELAAGGTLRDSLRVAGLERPLSDRLADARAVCAGLAAIHAVGITHRDVTPQNVLRMTDGRLVLSDFGLAIEGAENDTIQGGTPRYMPPETAMGHRSDQRSDVWQLGAILHELVFGGRPEWETRARGLVLRFPAGPGSTPLLEELGRLCADCLEQNPGDRPASAMIVAARLAAAEMSRPRAGWGRFVRRRGWIVVAVGLLAAAGGAALGRRASAPHPASIVRAGALDADDRVFVRDLVRRLDGEGRHDEADRLARATGLGSKRPLGR